MKKVRTADDETIVSYDIDVKGVIRKYMSKIKTVGDGTAVTEEENRARAEGQAGSQQ